MLHSSPSARIQGDTSRCGLQGAKPKPEAPPEGPLPALRGERVRPAPAKAGGEGQPQGKSLQLGALRALAAVGRCEAGAFLLPLTPTLPVTLGTVVARSPAWTAEGGGERRLLAGARPCRALPAGWRPEDEYPPHDILHSRHSRSAQDFTRYPTPEVGVTLLEACAYGRWARARAALQNSDARSIEAPLPPHAVARAGENALGDNGAGAGARSRPKAAARRLAMTKP
jgi:hypothetical protein